MTRFAIRVARSSAAFLFCAVLAGSAFAAPPARVALVYELTRNGQPLADLVEVLEHGAGAYAIVSEAKGKGALAALPLGLFRRESRGEVTAAGLRPSYFRDQRGGRLAIAELDWAAGELVTEFRGRREVRPLEGPMHDRLTLVYNFAFLAPPEGEIHVRATDGRGVSDYRYVVVGRESIDVGAGRFDAMKLARVREAGDERETVIWLAADRHRLPLRILVVEADGTRMDQTLERIQD
jgi:hypothetical protein